MDDKTVLNKTKGCLLGGAIGDALGYPIEFMDIDQIHTRHGYYGIQELELDKETKKAIISDDTQMTLSTAEGLILANDNIRFDRAITINYIYQSYLQWLATQGYTNKSTNKNSFLSSVNELRKVRSPGDTCIKSLLSGSYGTIKKPINDSKGCGGLMRIAPVGLVYRHEESFEMGVHIAALTHGSERGYAPAGFFSYLISLLLMGYNLETAIQESLKRTFESKLYNHSIDYKVIQAVKLVEFNKRTDQENIELIGKGWIAEEALAIAIYCSLKYQNDFKRSLQIAVNHSGDSDSTGSLTGQILGAYLGLEIIPKDWINKIELKDLIIYTANELNMLKFRYMHNDD
jgi:ADP-ribosylglycohydrolase